jgi:hypothetical protein
VHCYGIRCYYNHCSRESECMVRDDSPAKLAVIREWDKWARRHPNDAKVSGGMLFFSYLQKERPDLLLDFKTPGNKWQTVHAWLLSARRVKE